MLALRKSEDRGKMENNWLKARYSFSFANYHDPTNIRFRSIRVINEDRISPGAGFGLHPHENMEIITYVIDGELEHIDSLGNKGRISSGEIQMMSAGTGIEHSEKNPSDSKALHLLQIWIIPEEKNIEPRYGQLKIPAPSSSKVSKALLVSKGANEGSLDINQDVSLWLLNIPKEMNYTLDLDPNRYAWLQVISGESHVASIEVKPGDALEIAKESSLEIKAESASQMLFFDLK